MTMHPAIEAAIKPIETRYRGYRFRSRLEARWAVFFDAIGLKWEYEPEGYSLGEAGYYLPDFWLPYPLLSKYPNAGYFVEVKGTKPDDAYMGKLNALASQSLHTCLCLVGTPWSFVHACARRDSEVTWYRPNSWLLPSPDHEAWLVFSRWETCQRFDYDRAFDTARSARFEHGESGAT